MQDPCRWQQAQQRAHLELGHETVAERSRPGARDWRQVHGITRKIRRRGKNFGDRARRIKVPKLTAFTTRTRTTWPCLALPSAFVYSSTQKRVGIYIDRKNASTLQYRSMSLVLLHKRVVYLTQPREFIGHSHVDKDYVGSDFRSDELDHTAEVGHKAVGYHEVGDDIRIQRLKKPDTGIVSSHTQHLSRAKERRPGTTFYTAVQAI